MTDVQVYAKGPLACSACAASTLTGEDVAAAVTEQDAAALRDLNIDVLPVPWQISKDEIFKGGEPNPCECNDDPGRKHWLLEC